MQIQNRYLLMCPSPTCSWTRLQARNTRAAWIRRVDRQDRVVSPKCGEAITAEALISAEIQPPSPPSG